ncbi:MAG: M12 family metallo-peptidase [Planctomycetota bacterium]|nr:M12 family metallo-peptidase [Planctomycetota bacterium]
MRIATACVGLLLSVAGWRVATPVLASPAPEIVPHDVAISGPVNPASQEGLWLMLDSEPRVALGGPPWIRPSQAQYVVLDYPAMVEYLKAAPPEARPENAGIPNEPLILSLPMPDGTYERFLVVDSPVMEPGLAAKLPETRTFLGQGLDTPQAVVRFDYTPAGFHAMILSPEGTVFIDPITRGDISHYASYYVRDYTKPHSFQCLTQTDPNRPTSTLDRLTPVRSGPVRREYQLAVATTGEYTAFHGGTVPAGLNAVVTAITRLNLVYENEFAIRFLLVANNDQLIFTNPDTDPYEDDNPGQMLQANTGVINQRIGAASYDVGHVFSTGGGGVAGLGVVCGAQKGRGVTGQPAPIGDPFVIDYVAHEVGHQFNANHSFAGCGNAQTATSMEPGSGSTIMAYAGICGSDNLQSNSDDYFHSVNFDEVLRFITTGAGGTCDTEVATGNTAPVATAPITRTIPRRTPFTLTGSATDVDGDALTYCWEERELGPAQFLGQPDNGLTASFRSFSPGASPSRTFPRIQSVLGGAFAAGERYYDVARNPASFRLTARDNRAGAGGVNTADLNLTITDQAGPFSVTAPAGGANWPANSAQTVTWNVANTNAAPINVANVRITMSTDGGATFPTVLAASTPNDGSHPITVPNVATNAGRIRIEAIGSYFFNVSPGNFLTSGTAPPPPTNPAAIPNAICVMQTTRLFATVPPGDIVEWYTGSCDGTLVGIGSPITLQLNEPGTITFFARTRRGTAVSAICASVTVQVNAFPRAPEGVSFDRDDFCFNDDGPITLFVAGGSGSTVRWFAGGCGSQSIGTGPELTIPSPTATTTYFARWETPCGVSACRSVTVNVNQVPAVRDVSPDTIVNEGEDITLFAEVDSRLPVNYQWQRNSVNIPGATSETYQILRATPSATGLYRCLVTNACGAGEPSRNIQVTVNRVCPGDFNRDGQVDIFDYLDFVAALDAGDTRADFNADGQIDLFDYLDFVAAFAGPC